MKRKLIIALYCMLYLEVVTSAYLAYERMGDYNNANRYKEMYFVNGGTMDDLQEIIGSIETEI